MSLSRIVLPSGRPVDLMELQLSSTYGGMLEGYPCALVNKMKITGLLRSAETAFPSAPVHLIPPEREYPDDDTGPLGPFGPVEVIPKVACIGYFRSTAVDPSLDPVLHISRLTVAWFQPTPETPSGSVENHPLRELAWEQLAEDVEL
ncbi:hypothetical protein BN159_4633 [Streptomyces davaonensis JCM 4913]|uniref:Uncharacterized protein n=1 Tax=Streptomyces davaonensis (strain DSM 101723 / JCM 4913 / KCC S-0913 / 768) TaxID=1214101 RepID=K4R7C9_STRDJ|nr:hypothetical protein [Streptomyces davaonensis]CCK29012.1 hypothetical protein BN159_4633 [Streptomyces davaonensis JCM 4913]